MLNRIRSHLRNNDGSEYMEKLILIVISFVVGGLLLGIISGVFDEAFQGSLKNTIQDVFNW